MQQHSGCTLNLQKVDAVLIDALTNESSVEGQNDSVRDTERTSCASLTLTALRDNPTHTTASPYCHSNYEWEYTYGGKTLPFSSRRFQ